MTRIRLFIIPLAEERVGVGGGGADIKKCVVAGPSLTICHGGPVAAAMHAYHCHGYQRSSSLEIVH